MRWPRWKTENGTVPRFDPAPWYWPVLWWGEGIIAAELAAHWWPAHRTASLALMVKSLLGLKAVHIVQLDEDDTRATGTRHIPVNQFSAFPLEPRVRHEVPAVTVRESAYGEIEAVIAKPGAGVLRRARLRWQMTRKGFAAVTADDIAALATLLRDADPIGPQEEPPPEQPR